MMVRISFSLGLALVLAAFAQTQVTASGQCNFVGSIEACKQQPVGSVCALNGKAGVCAPKDKLGSSFNCICVEGDPPKTPRCPDGKRWSPVKGACIKPMESSPDGRSECFTPFYWDPDSNTCRQLF